MLSSLLTAPSRRVVPRGSLFAAAMVLCLGCNQGSSAGQPTAGVAGGDQEKPSLEWALAIHGGVGVLPRDAGADQVEEYEAALTAALEAGKRRLEGGGTSLDAVQDVVRILEDDPKFNAGRGAVYTHEETHELDAAIMDGRSLACGSVAAVRTVKNPIDLARLVMERSPHVFLMGEGAETFAQEAGLEPVDQEYFHTERRYRELQEAKQKDAAPPKELSTVGAVALDRHGNLAAATSTGGLPNKRFGRVGDVPVIGAGTFADNRTCAISGTGKGEEFIRHTVARSIAARMELAGMDLEEATRDVIHGRLKPGDGGVIVVSRRGQVALVYNTEGMFRGAADSSGRFEVAIWD
jgi:beta-aspartyl-peptidase (threonine type)